MLFLKAYFEKINVEKYLQTTKNHEKLTLKNTTGQYIVVYFSLDTRSFNSVPTSFIC